ncbi:MAG: FliH/SctL family protein [Polyangiales bacterium]|nr:hypothetical protein [Myxococcales bacterium]MCB9661345.1 hypothetical protein [Sandaracinaceae bacterium]
MASSVVRSQYPEVRARAVLDAELEAARVLADAHAEAERVRRAAEEEYETWRAQAQRHGEEQASSDARAAQLAALSREQQALRALRDGTVPLVVQATHKLVRGAFEQHPEIVREVVLEAMRHLRLATTLELEVHPDDVAYVNGLRGLERPLVVRTADDLLRGECRVLSDVGSVDARFSTQLEALATALQTALRGASEAGASTRDTRPPSGPTERADSGEAEA